MTLQPASKRTRKRHRPAERQAKAIDMIKLVLQGSTEAKACANVGISPGTFRHWKKMPDVTEVVQAVLRNELERAMSMAQRPLRSR